MRYPFRKALLLSGCLFALSHFLPTHAQTTVTVQVQRDLIYGTASGVDLKLDIYKPSHVGPLPIIVFVHGGGWSSGDKRSMEANARYFAERGYLGISVNYRLSPQFKMPNHIEDVKCAVRWVRSHAQELGANPEKIGALGSSAGGHLVGLLGVTDGTEGMEGQCGDLSLSSRVQAVVPYFGPMDLIRLWANTNPPGDLASERVVGARCSVTPEPCKKHSPITYVSSDDPPFLLVHGTQDPVVPFEQSVLMRDALNAAKVEVELFPIEGAGHGWPFNSTPGQQALARVLPFFEKHLRAK
jgi:acetyl esterase/lipase